jgi:hypothetical protein
LPLSLPFLFSPKLLSRPFISFQPKAYLIHFPFFQFFVGKHCLFMQAELEPILQLLFSLGQLGLV